MEIPMAFGRVVVFECMESGLVEFEPDPDAAFGFQIVQPGSREADGLEWIAWDDADGEFAWAGDELRQIALGSAT